MMASARRSVCSAAARRVGTGALLLLTYALAFALLHRAARPWGGASFFSLWYPAAGLRFAVLWWRGPRIAPLLMVSELCAQWMLGSIPHAGPDALRSALGVLRPGATYALAIWGVRRLTASPRGPLTLPPMPMGLAALAAPIFNAAVFVPIEMLMPAAPQFRMVRTAPIVALTGLAVGDTLGILVLTPVLLWIIGGVADRHRLAWPRVALRPLAEDAAVLGGCMLLTIGLLHAGLGIQPIPALLAGGWIGLRHGRAGAWIAIIAMLALFLPWSARSVDDPARLSLHLGVAAAVLVTWFAGNFFDAQQAARRAVTSRDRLLFQAERLKTLRAMSVAVIHEISQPLTTLSIEAGHLRQQVEPLNPEIAESAAIVDRKAQALSELVRRLRRFGGREVEDPSPLPVVALVRSAVQIVAPDARHLDCVLEVETIDAGLVVQAQEIELTQALVNILRNAISATADRRVGLAVHHTDETVVLAISNAVDDGPPRRGSAPSGRGMGVGLIIARTIVEAHGGTLMRGQADNPVTFIVSLPRMAVPA